MLRIIGEVGLGKFVKAGILEIYRKIIRECLFNSYSQNWEDLKIDKLINFQKNGFYLEIGGYDPKRLSNTYRFYKRGWRGVVAEPNPEARKKFVKIRPGDKFVSMGIGVNEGIIKYYQYSIPALNTFSEKEVKNNTKRGFKVSTVLEIKVIGVKKFLNKYISTKKIDFLSIDTEGLDFQILKNWDWKYKPKVICVEKDNDKRIEKMLTEKGYKLTKESKYNLIFFKN